MSDDIDHPVSLADSIAEMSDALPAPVKRNLLKALGQLCTAAIDVPVAHLEGKAAEKRAETAARVRLIERSASEIASEMNFDPEYGRRAVKKFGERVLRERVNLDLIGEQATDLLSKAGPFEQNGEQPEISENWLNQFERSAAQASEEELQARFASLLAGEIAAPGTFSIRAISAISEMDSLTSKVFQRACSLSIAQMARNKDGDEIFIDCRVPCFTGNPGQNALSGFGLSFNNLNILSEAGLIITDYNSYMEYNACIANEENHVSAYIEFGGFHYALVPMSDNDENRALKISGVAFTSVGRQLRKICERTSVVEFEQYVKTELKNRHFELARINGSAA